MTAKFVILVDVHVFCNDLLNKQLTIVAEPNTIVSGDLFCRNMMYTFFTPNHLRTIFFQTVQTRQNVTRIRALFGSPPFYFLKWSDKDCFRASGFSINRVSLVSKFQFFPNFSQFGHAHFIDKNGVQYKIQASSTSNDNNLWFLQQSIRTEKCCNLFYKLPRGDRTSRPIVGATCICCRAI